MTNKYIFAWNIEPSYDKDVAIQIVEAGPPPVPGLGYWC